MNNPVRKISFAGIAAVSGEIIVFALEVYKAVLNAKCIFTDSLITLANGAKSRTERFAKRRTANRSEIKTENKKDKENTSMKKSTFWALIAFLVAVGAAVAGILYYLRKREAELEEYDDMLFNEDYLADYLPKEEECCEDGCCCEEYTQE